MVIDPAFEHLLEGTDGEDDDGNRSNRSLEEPLVGDDEDVSDRMMAGYQMMQRHGSEKSRRPEHFLRNFTDLKVMRSYIR